MNSRAGQNLLAGTWLLFFIGQVALLALRAVWGSDDPTYSSATNDIWKWYLPMVLPTVSIIVAAIFSSGPISERNSNVRQNVFGVLVAMALSAIYLLSISALILLPPSLGLTPEEHVKLLRDSNYWLGGVQLCVGGALGHFFAKAPRR
jgi:hypothetical protein